MVQLVYRSGFRESTCHLTVVALWDVNGNRNGLWHCHSAIVQKLVAPLLHNSCTLLFDCIIPVGGPCNVHITCIRILLIPIDCRQASGRPRFTSFLTCINTRCGFHEIREPLFMIRRGYAFIGECIERAKILPVQYAFEMYSTFL